MTADDALVLTGVTHRFGPTLALRDASLRVRTGTLHALLGENGAGKTTLLRIAFGLLRPDAGSLLVGGVERRFRSSADAISAGLGMVHQHFMLIPALTVTENVILGGRGRLDRNRRAEELRSLAARAGLPVDPSAVVDGLPVSAQQRVEILKALSHDARVLILDEPTAVLAPDESEQLLTWVRGYVAAGGTAVLITHKLREARRFADDITVMRRGETVLRVPAADTDERTLVEALAGALGDGNPELSGDRVAPGVGRGEPRLVLEDATYRDASGVVRVREVSLTVRSGEVVGVIGVEGSGHRELLRLLAGRLTPTSGASRLPSRVGFVPEDRLADALIASFTLTENVALADAATSRGRLDWRALRERTSALLVRADVLAEGPGSRAAALSGGNQQKFVLAREQAVAGTALVVEHPTRGLDIRASARVLSELAHAARERGVAVVVHSPDLDEVLAVATRVVACFGGRVREVPWPADREDRAPFARALVGAD